MRNRVTIPSFHPSEFPFLFSSFFFSFLFFSLLFQFLYFSTVTSFNPSPSSRKFTQISLSLSLSRKRYIYLFLKKSRILVFLFNQSSSSVLLTILLLVFVRRNFCAVGVAAFRPANCSEDRFQICMSLWLCKYYTVALYLQYTVCASSKCACLF